jgi:hypothetical protein
MFLRYCELYNPDVCIKGMDKLTFIYFGVTEVCEKESQGY